MKESKCPFHPSFLFFHPSSLILHPSSLERSRVHFSALDLRAFSAGVLPCPPELFEDAAPQSKEIRRE